MDKEKKEEIDNLLWALKLETEKLKSNLLAEAEEDVLVVSTIIAEALAFRLKALTEE